MLTRISCWLLDLSCYDHYLYITKRLSIQVWLPWEDNMRLKRKISDFYESGSWFFLRFWLTSTLVTEIADCSEGYCVYVNCWFGPDEYNCLENSVVAKTSDLFFERTCLLALCYKFLLSDVCRLSMNGTAGFLLLLKKLPSCFPVCRSLWHIL